MARVDRLRMRAGQLFCSCDSDGLPIDLDRLPVGAGIGRMAFAFGASVLSQVLTLSVLPLASAQLVSQPWQLPLPYIALLFGAALAGFPASILMDMFGRKSAFALGASLGIAGGILAAYAVIERQFLFLLIAALWLGMAQGFALFYRHAGAIVGHAGGLVFGAGVIGALLGPFLVEAFSQTTGPLAAAYVLGAAGLANLITLGLAVGLAASDIEIEAKTAFNLRPNLGRFTLATLIAALAWFAMTGIMARAPLMMAGCGIGFGMVASAMAVHLAAMYVPGFVIGRWIAYSGGIRVGGWGLALIMAGGCAMFWQVSSAGFSLALMIAGFGWGTATLGAMAYIHRDGRPSSLWLALHDVTLFLAALLGALVFGRVG
jgi:MFS family permease